MQAGRGGGPGAGGRGRGRYMKGRLPEGVDFAAYPGRSSTPLPTAESKGAERINQLKIWNEAATNDDKRRLHTAQGKQALASTGSGSRRTDSFKDAKERHSASFQGDGDAPPGDGEIDPAVAVASESSNGPGAVMNGGAAKQNVTSAKADMFADRSDSEDEEDEELEDANAAGAEDTSTNAREDEPTPVAPATNAPAAPSANEINANATAGAAAKPAASAAATQGNEAQQPKPAKKGCCTIQ